jgi:hypothetical protein
VVCDKCTEPYTISPNDHNWAEIFDGWYYCFDCGLENANGASGSIIMEDLTDAYGNGEYYVVGYYAYSDITFSEYISLILADGTEVAIWSGIDFITIDGIRAYAFSKAAVDEWAAANGYTDYDVRFSFVPVGAEGSFDYGITFAEPTVITGAITGNVSFKEYVGAGETKTFTITPTEDALWVFMSFADSDTYAFLTDENGEWIARDDDSGQNNNFMIRYDLKAGNTYIINVRWYNNYTVGTVPLFFGVVPTATK